MANMYFLLCYGIVIDVIVAYTFIKLANLLLLF